MSALDRWQHETVSNIFNVTLDRRQAESSSWSKTWLKQLSTELASENNGVTPQLSASIADQILIARLSLDTSPDSMSDDHDPGQLTVLASLPTAQTSFDYLVASWKRAKFQEHSLRKSLPQSEHPKAIAILDEIRSLIISYTGLVLQTPDMFPNYTKPNGATISPLVLVDSLTKVAAPVSSFGLASSAPTDDASNVDLTKQFEVVDPENLPAFLAELANRFGDGEGLEDILGPPFQELTRRIRDGDTDGSSAPAASSSSAPSSSTAPQPAGAAGVNPAALNQALANQDVQSVIANLLAGRIPGAPSAAAPGLGLDGRPKEGLTISGLEWRPYVNAIVEAVEIKKVATMLATLPAFNPESTTAPRMELDSLLGPVIRLSAFPDAFPSLTQQYLSNPDNRSRQEIESNFNSIQSTMEIVHTLNFRIFNAMVRSSPQAREHVLSYWGRACELNAKRGAMQVQSELVASDGYMINLYEMLLRFADPFMDAGLTKMDRIDLEYLRKQSRFDVSELTRINATEAEAKEWTDAASAASSSSATPPNFITEVFYIAVRLNNLGLGKAVRKMEEKEKEMNRFKKRIAETEADRPMWSTLPQAPQYENFLKRAKMEVDKLHSEILAYQSQLLSNNFLQKVITFNSFLMNWLIRVADPKASHPHPQVQLPLPQQVPERFRMLPEHIFEDVCDLMLFISRANASLPDSAKNDLVTFCTTFLSSGWYIKNPFLKAKLAEILFYNVIPFGSHRNGILGDVVNIHPLALNHLVPALMSFWIEAENTGSHTQFYDKFNMRYHLSQIFKAIWNNPQHKRQLHRVSSTSPASASNTNGSGSNGEAGAAAAGQDFVVFINRLMNDVTYLLDDALEKLQELHTKQQEEEAQGAGSSSTPQERQEREGHIRSLEQQIKSDLQLGTEFLRLLGDFTSETKEAFMTPEIVDRLAAMLDYNLDLLAGTKTQNLKVKDPKKVFFEPRNLLRLIMGVYLNLCSQADFVRAIARDGRSYSSTTFKKAGGIASKYMLKSPVELDAWGGMIDKIEEFKQMDLEDEEDFGDIPDEFLDPLMATIMKDPVILPKSRITVDRSTIKAHLLSDATDPFNRSPLKIDDVIPDNDLREKIESFITERRGKGKQSSQ